MRTARPVLCRSLLIAGLVTLIGGALVAAVLAVSDTLFFHASSADLESEVWITYQQLQRFPQLRDEAIQRGQFRGGMVLWQVDRGGTVTGTSGFPPALPDEYHKLDGRTTAVVGGITYRLAGGPLVDGGWLVVGADTAMVVRPQQDVLQAQLVTVPPALLAVLLAALAVGRWVAGPIERARQHQLAFTANASHELRTPLAVLEGEISLARSRPRSVEEYRQALDRVAEETAAVHGLVDDLLWLARFESEPRPPVVDRMQLGEAARQAGERFAGLAEHRGLSLTVVAEEPVVIEAPGPWVERLLGVLLANACTYTPSGGRVQVTVLGGAAGPGLLVDDSGPGVRPDDRARIFDRFFRASEHGDGAGLGLSIGDAIVRSTSGVWEVTTSPLGGARFGVRWPTVSSRARILRQWPRKSKSPGEM
jgi:signal transduction histidine kinase